MKRTLIAATIAALTIPVVVAAPAHATNDIAVSVDNSQGTYPLSVYLKVDCGDGGVSTVGSPDAPLVFRAGEKSGEYPFCVLGNWGDGTFEFTLTANGQTVNCNGGISSPVTDWVKLNNLTGDAECLWKFTIDTSSDQFVIPNFLSFLKNNEGVYNFSVNPIYVKNNKDAYLLGNVTAAVNVNAAVTRSKITNYVTRNPNRVTAMAKRFVDAPGSLINIHGYGPDRNVALARAEHVRNHLISEISRLGGDPDEYPVMVIYAGNPDHKKNVHVTIHQHAASSITVPEGGTLTIGGAS